MARKPALEGADPDFPVPPGLCVEVPDSSGWLGQLLAKISCKRRGKPETPDASEKLSDEDDVTEEEFAWMEARRKLSVTHEQLALDYGEDEACRMERAFAERGLSHLLGTLNWPGIGTRWQEFLEWSCSVVPAPETPAIALRGFGRFLGRVTTYRALAIDETALRKIVAADCIFPSGQLRVGSEALEDVVNTKGIRKVCVARLFIKHLHRLLGVDPSISLHDDWQTTSLIASGYASYDKLDPARSRKVHLFELSCPKVESIGWTLQEVALQAGAVLDGDFSKHDPWFQFPAPAVPEGIWFDGRWQRTERYGLYGVPFLSQRLQQLYVFESNQQLGEAVLPFARRQAELHDLDP